MRGTARNPPAPALRQPQLHDHPHDGLRHDADGHRGDEIRGLRPTSSSPSTSSASSVSRPKRCSTPGPFRRSTDPIPAHPQQRGLQGGHVGSSSPCSRCSKIIGQVAASDVTVMVTGGERHGQGNGGALHLPAQPPRQPPLHGGELCGHPAITSSSPNSLGHEKAPSPGAHAAAAHGKIRAVRRRHALPR